MRRTLFLLVALAALTACNPRLYPPQVETPDNYLYAGRFRQDSLAGSEEWWHVFRDPTLDSLISQALANNRDLAVAYSRVEEADRQIAVARAGFLPSFGVGVSAEGDYNAETKIVQKYAVEPQMTWEVSLFGALRNSTRAARAEETIGTSFVVLSSRKYEGRSRGSPAPEKMISAFSEIAVRTMSEKLLSATMTLTPITPRVFARALRISSLRPIMLFVR